MMNTYKVYNKAADGDWVLYDTVEDTPGGPIIEAFLCSATEKLLKRNGGQVEIRNEKGDVLSRYTRNTPY